jgi:glycosyltransferase involved in cell wall biosynthesis
MVNKILYIEANTDNTIGGSHHCLMEMVKNIDCHKYHPNVLFFRNNTLVKEFERICKTHIIQPTSTFNLKNNKFFYFVLNKIPGGLLCGGLFQKLINFVCVFLKDIWKYSMFLIKHKFSIVHFNNGPRQVEWVIACKICRVKCISHIRGTFRHDLAKFEKIFIPYYDALIPISKTVEKYTQSLGVKLPKMYLINDGIDTASVERKIQKSVYDIREEFKVKDDEYFIGVVNNIKQWKGQHVAIESIRLLKKRVPNVKCIFVGNISDDPYDQKYFNDLQSMVKNYNIEKNITFTGFRNDSIDLINSFDLILHTSIANEGFPRVILESMTLKKLIIASAIGPNCEILDNDVNGLLFEPGNSEELAKKIEESLLNSEKIANLGLNAKDKVENNFNIKINMGKTQKIYEDILS